MSENNSYSSQSLIWKCHECGKYYGNVMNVRKQSLKSVSITSIENKKTKESRMKKPCLKRISTAYKAYSIDENEKIIKTKEAYVKKTSLKQVLITYIETYKCNECDYEFKEIRKLKNHK